jgi:hypothetical protein
VHRIERPATVSYAPDPEENKWKGTGHIGGKAVCGKRNPIEVN